MKKFLILCLFLSGCIGKINPEFQPYYNSFAKDFNIFPYLVNSDFGMLKDNIAGSCNYLTLSITIKKEYWNLIDQEMKTELFYHELLHCTVFASHTSKMLEDGCPFSIMYPENFGDGCFYKHKSDYIKQFQRSILQ